MSKHHGLAELDAETDELAQRDSIMYAQEQDETNVFAQKKDESEDDDDDDDDGDDGSEVSASDES